MISQPDKTEYPEWASAEIQLVHYDNLLFGFEDNFKITLDFLKAISPDKLDFRYADDKWTIKQIWQHVLDVERILCYRALRYSRQDVNILQGIDGKKDAELSLASKRKWDEIITEYSALKTSTICLFRSFTPEMTLLKGTTGKSTMSVRALGYLILGHEMHHINTIKTRYL